ncbi:hypothetical protein ACMYSQ_002141 [Aspergillus niger]
MSLLDYLSSVLVLSRRFFVANFTKSCFPSPKGEPLQHGPVCRKELTGQFKGVEIFKRVPAVRFESTALTMLPRPRSAGSLIFPPFIIVLPTDQYIGPRSNPLR